MSNNDSSFQDFSSERKYLRKKPYCEINLSELSKTGKYRIVGTVTSVTDDTFTINDDSDQIEAILTTPQNLEVKEGLLLRLFGFIEFKLLYAQTMQPENRYSPLLKNFFLGCRSTLYLSPGDS